MKESSTDLTTEQKIELMTLASKIDIDLGRSSTSLDQMIINYQKMIKEITSTSKKN